MEVTASEGLDSRPQAAGKGETTIVTPPEAEGTRLDLFLLQQAPALTRGAVQRAIHGGAVRIAGKRVIKPSTIVHTGQHVSWKYGEQESVPPLSEHSPPLPEFKILHEDSHLLVVDKPAGVPIHAGVKREATLVEALILRYPHLKNVGDDPTRPGIVHRLDKDTSGVLLVARTTEMYEHLRMLFLERQVRKEYVALVHGRVPEAEGVVKLPIARSKRNPLRRTIAKDGAGKEAETAFRVLERFREHSLLAVYPRTGRMHQIRVHLSHLGFPVAGDPLYGRKSRYRTPPGLQRQFLHARAISFTLPSAKMKMFESPLPDDLQRVLDALRGTPPTATGRPLTYRWRTPRAAA